MKGYLRKQEVKNGALIAALEFSVQDKAPAVTQRKALLQNKHTHTDTHTVYTFSKDSLITQPCPQQQK